MRVCESVIASIYPARLADKRVKRLGSQESVCGSEGETPGGFGYQRHRGVQANCWRDLGRGSMKRSVCMCVCTHVQETTRESKDPGAATELMCSYCEYMLSSTGWTWWHGPVAALPLLGYQILQQPTRGNVRKEP